MNAAIPDKVAPTAAPAAYPLLFDDDVVVDDDDVEEAPVFMVRLKNEDALNELNEEVEDSAANTPFVEERRDEDLAAKTPARFAALLNMMIEIRCCISINKARDLMRLRYMEIDHRKKLFSSSPLF